MSAGRLPDLAPVNAQVVDGYDDRAPTLLTSFVGGGSFVHDQPAHTPAVWGRGDDVLLAEGESLIIAGGQGVGKTTLAGNVTRGLVADTPHDVLGLPVTPRDRTLYLAMDRPRQAARSLRRQLADVPRDVLDERLTFMVGPPPHDLARHPGVLAALAEQAGAQMVIVDSLKDAAIGLSDDEVGAGWNRARQNALRAGVDLLELHHIRKVPADKRPDIGDVYGSTWITSGAGSVLLLAGAPGDPVVKAWHLKQPMNEVGPWNLLHDQQAGTMTVDGADDLLALVRASGGVTAKEAAARLFDTLTPTRAQKEKARRRLVILVDQNLAYPSSTGASTPTVYVPAGVPA